MIRAIRKSRLFATRVAIGGLIFLLPRSSEPATVTPSTLSSWDEYVDRSKAGLAQDIRSPERLLRVSMKHQGSSDAGYESGLEVGLPQGSMIPIPAGLIHRWKGAVFIRNASSLDLLAALQDYDSYTDISRPAVIDSKLLSRAQDEFRYRLKFAQKGFGVKAGLSGVFRSNYYRLSSNEGYSLTEATTLDELENPGTPEERLIPFGASHGYVEKIFTIIRYHQANRGVYVEIETLTLSRGVPISVRWMISPVIQRFSRQTMKGTLESLSDRIRATGEFESASGERPRSLEHGGW